MLNYSKIIIKKIINKITKIIKLIIIFSNNHNAIILIKIIKIFLVIFSNKNLKIMIISTKRLMSKIKIITINNSKKIIVKQINRNRLVITITKIIIIIISLTIRCCF